MKKLLTVTLVFVFALALVFALGCNKKEEPATEGGMDQGMEQTPPAMTDSMAAMDTMGTAH
ncbi:MAG TPA: hypothetical protein VJW75_08990 [Candidatus Eisenbacteria bacterium]|nr:hypothetical protein [Candidatus Eisenbacteria bacterium]